MVERWQRLNFFKILTDLLNRIPHNAINYMQFYLLLRQARIIYLNHEQQSKFKIFFQKSQGAVDKLKLITIFILRSICIQHCQQFFIISMRESDQEREHKGDACFEFWQQKMKEKYGSYHLWYAILCGEKDQRRGKFTKISQTVTQILQSTKHQHCATNILAVFPKNVKNEIELTTFMNTLMICFQKKRQDILQKHKKMYSMVSLPGKKDKRSQKIGRYGTNQSINQKSISKNNPSTADRSSDAFFSTLKSKSRISILSTHNISASQNTKKVSSYFKFK